MKFKDLKTGQFFLSKDVPDHTLRKSDDYTGSRLAFCSDSYNFAADDEVTGLIQNYHEIPGLGHRLKMNKTRDKVTLEFAAPEDAKAFYEFLTPQGADFRRQMERVNLVNEAQSLILYKQELQEKFDAAGLVMDLVMIEDLSERAKQPAGKIAAQIQEK